MTATKGGMVVAGVGPTLKRQNAKRTGEEAPMRAELFTVNQLIQHARELSGWHRIAKKKVGVGIWRRNALLLRLDDNAAALKDANALLTQANTKTIRLTPAAEWLIDNYHLIEEQIRTARKHFPNGYHRVLPKLSNGPTAGSPRVYDIAIELISHSHGRIDLEGVLAFVAAYQSSAPLSLGELWAIPIMLRLALIENLCRVVEKISSGRRDRQNAGVWVERMRNVAITDPANVVLVLAEMVKASPQLTNPFVSEISTQLQGQGPALAFPLAWIDQRLAKNAQTIEQVFQAVSQDQAMHQVDISNTIGSLRLLNSTDWRAFVEESSVVEDVLRNDPAGVYGKMNFETRNEYRQAIEHIAKSGELSEFQVAQLAQKLSREASPTDLKQTHIGYYLVGEGRPLIEEAAHNRIGMVTAVRRASTPWKVLSYLSAIALVTVGTTTVVLWNAPPLVSPVGPWGGWRFALAVAVLAISSSQLAMGVVNWALTLLVKPDLLPRLDFSLGIPTNCAAVVAIPTLLTDSDECSALLESIEVRFLANRDDNLSFALLSDFRDARTETCPGDDAILKHAQSGIEALNLKYAADGRPNPFYLFHRSRRWNPCENAWMGWERKRGKLLEFNAALRGDTSKFSVVVGETERLNNVKYVIALDADTQLPREAAHQLIGTMAHPLNQPEFDQDLGRVTRGYTILQPRVAITMQSAAQSRFSRLFSGEPGIDPYTRAVSDVYQDAFAEGSFVGKAIYDVDSFRLAIGDRLPENRVLSHDLLEGTYTRCGLVSDVTLFEDFPSSYSVDIGRRHRWMRGDWQLVRWLFSNVPTSTGKSAPNPLSFLSRWKLFDNLRRGLFPIALLMVLVLGWNVPNGALFASLVSLAILIVPSFLSMAVDLLRGPKDIPLLSHAKTAALTFVRQATREGFNLILLPYEAWIALSAIATTSWRLIISRRNLLQWRTASEAQRTAKRGLGSLYRSMWFAPTCSLVSTAFAAKHNPQELHSVLAISLLWTLSPALVWWMSQPFAERRSELSFNDLKFLRAASRRTWRYFESFVDAEDNHLPPDNFQEYPPQGIAHRTSPTNIGLALTANLAAYDFGYVSAAELISRTTQTFATLDRLTRYRGHFFNWYSTTTLEPLHPIYISTVDSGNFAGHLLTLAVGLRELANQPILRRATFEGLTDTLETLTSLETLNDSFVAVAQRLHDQLKSPPESLRSAHMFFVAFSEAARQLVTLAQSHLGASSDEVAWWTDVLLSECNNAHDNLMILAPWVALTFGEGVAPQMEGWPRLDNIELTLTEVAQLPQILSGGAPPAGTHSDSPVFAQAVSAGANAANAQIRDANLLAVRCEEFCDADYAFLYLPERRLLSIGYNLVDHRLDPNCYDLLASEARLASFVAIALDKLPQEHWFRLGRSLTTAGTRPSLLSWSGSMFEYLMPLLVMPTYLNTVLDNTYQGVVERQIEYGRERDVPWGVSESAYNKTDAHLNYQYRAFGVPGLGFKRGLGDDTVIAPYASAMALMISPKEACANLQRLASEGHYGKYGFYEAIDYTTERLPRGRTQVAIQSYMVHHQAMAFLSFLSALHDQPMQKRFASYPAFQATVLLLQERVPQTQTVRPPTAERSTQIEKNDESAKFRVLSSPSSSPPQVHLLSNGNYHVAVTGSGGGYSRWRDKAVTRWHEDPTRDCWGTFFYLRDHRTKNFWSVAHQPTLTRAETYEAIYSEGRAEFRRRDGDIDTHVEISVSPEDDVELRRISVTNRGRSQRTLDLTSFAEVVLATAASDAAHPAFSNLFVQTEILPEFQAILCSRRPRSGTEPPIWMLHMMTVQGTTLGTASYETGRSEFIGRGRSVRDPIAMHSDHLGGSEGFVLDPIVAIRNAFEIEPHATIRVHVVTGVAESRAAAIALIEKYSDRHSPERLFELSWTHSQVVLRRLDITEADTFLYERLAASVLYANPALRAPRSVILRNRRGQSSLWAHGISGDLPIVLVRIAEVENVGLVRQVILAHAYLQLKGLSFDLVIWNEDATGYRQVVQEEIMGLIASLREGNVLDKPGGIFVRRAENLSEEDKILMQTVARLVLTGSQGSLSDHINRQLHIEMPPSLFPARDRRKTAPLIPITPPPMGPLPGTPDGLQLFNGHGGFAKSGRQYVIVTAQNKPTPAPWVNVLANPWFGSVISESGSAYTWCENAHSYRLTPWHNDAVGDLSGEAFYIRDEDSGHFWSPTPLPARGSSPYTTKHGFGYSVFEHDEGGVATELTTFVATDAPIKWVTLRISNNSGRQQRLSLTAYFELVLGSQRSANVPHVITEFDLGGAIFARNSYNSEFSSRVAFLDCSERKRTASGDREEFIGRNGSLTNPACMSRAGLSGRVGAAMDPCLAMQVGVTLANGQSKEVVFSFGSGRDLADARLLTQRFAGTHAPAVALEQVRAYWNKTLGAVTIRTPDESLNILANGWLIYQVLSSRIWGRSGFYQSGGAFGFRDQLQDAMSLIHCEPSILREQILRSCAQQFLEGDVQHWWHPPTGRGVRTHISDDYLWLPNAVCRYVKTIGDTGVLGEKIAYLEGRKLSQNEESYYDLPSRSEELGTVYDHCVRSIRYGLKFGVHGLPLIGSGDWNDGMNFVGEHGKGESVWLAFFLYDVLRQFAEIARFRNDLEFAELCVQEATKLLENIEKHAWDGGWYLRAFFDDATPLGSRNNVDCQIDSLPQSWAVLSGAGNSVRAEQGLQAVEDRLIRHDLKLIQLFDPPFNDSDQNPGYIKGYVPGVRENGGQYTHAAIWVVMAFAAAGKTAKAWELFSLINPLRHGDSAASIAKYKVEPYVVAADVYTTAQHEGRGGWTWYTGSAGWMYRLVTESFLGLRLEGETLFITPRLPDSWPSAEIDYRFRETIYNIFITQKLADTNTRSQVIKVVCDGELLADGAIRLRDDQAKHTVEIELS